MTTPSNPKPAGDDRNLVPVDEQSAAAFEDRLHAFWRRNGGVVLGVCAAIFLGILAKGGWEMYQRGKQQEIAQAYAAANTPEQLKAFASANGDSELAGVAYLRIADEAYAAGRAAEAVTGYDKALEVLKAGPLAARAQIGRALAKVLAGRAADATSDLKKITEDPSQLEMVRSEAAYHLASLAAESGDVAEAQKYLAQVTQGGDPRTNPWAMRAMTLQMSLPATSTPSAPTQEASSGAAPITVPGR